MSDTELHDLLSDLADLAPTTLEREIDQARPWRTAIALAASVALIIGGGAVLLDQRSDDRATVIQDPTPTATPDPTPSPLPPPEQIARATKESSEAECRRAIAQVGVPADAVEQSTPPGLHLKDPTTSPSGDFASESRFWISPMPLDDVLAYVSSHQPPGVSPFGGSSTGTQRGVLQTKSLLAGLDGQAEMQFTVEPLADGTTGMRADAQCAYGISGISAG